MKKAKSKLTSTQIGALAENVVANELMIRSGGRLSPFQPVADDDGIDVLIYDKSTGNAVPLQIKSRTSALKKPGKNERGNTVHFEVRKATLRADRHGYLLCVLLSGDLTNVETAWLLPMFNLRKIASQTKVKYFIRANKQSSTRDKYKRYQCADMYEVADRITKILEQRD